MPDELTPVTTRCDIVCGQVKVNHDRINEMRSIQIETVGRDGRNGKLQQVRHDMGKLTEAVETNQKTIQAINTKVERLGVKLALIVSAASLAGGAAVKLILGG